MKLFKFLTIGLLVGALLVLFGASLAGAVDQPGHMGAKVDEGFGCSIGGGVDRAGDALSGAGTTDTHQVKNKSGKVQMNCVGVLPVGSHIPEQGVKQVGSTSSHLPINGNEVADGRGCGLFSGEGSTTNWTQTISSSDGSITLHCKK